MSTLAAAPVDADRVNVIHGHVIAQLEKTAFATTIPPTQFSVVVLKVTMPTSPSVAGGSGVSELIHQHAATHARIMKGIAETDHAVPQIKEQDRLIDDVRYQLTQSRIKLGKILARKQKEFAEHESWRDSHIKRFAYRATGQKEKFEERAAKEEREYFQAVQEEHQEKTVTDNLEQQLSEMEAVKKELEQIVSRRKGLEGELERLYEAIFSGSNPEFPDEDTKEEMSNQTLQDYFDTGEKLQAEANTAKALGDALIDLRTALRYMSSALSASQADIFGGRTFTDFIERDNLSIANTSVHRSRSAIEQARRVNPHVEPIPPVNINMGHLMSDVFFDNYFSDRAFHDQIERGVVEVEEAKRAVERQLKQAKWRQNRLKTQYAIREKNLEQARLALQKAREETFMRVLTGEAGDEGTALNRGGAREDPPPYRP